jgi:hypothetical protein
MCLLFGMDGKESRGKKKSEIMFVLESQSHLLKPVFTAPFSTFTHTTMERATFMWDI